MQCEQQAVASAERVASSSECELELGARALSSSCSSSGAYNASNSDSDYVYSSGPLYRRLRRSIRCAAAVTAAHVLLSTVCRGHQSCYSSSVSGARVLLNLLGAAVHFA